MVSRVSRKPHPPFRVEGARRASGPLALGALLAAALLAGPPAAAQTFWDEPGYATPRKAKQAKSPPSVVSYTAAAAKRKSKTEAVAFRRAEGPLIVNISLNRQRLTVYDAHGAIASSPVSSGRVGYATPAGVYTIVQKKRMHYSNLYESAPMPNMQRLTWSGIALHAGVLPGYPASHGCIRLPAGFSRKLFDMTRMGTRVIVSREPVTPVAIVHERLFTAPPPDDDVAAAAAALRETKVADASGTTGASTDAAHAPSSHLGYRERRRIAAEKLNAEIRTAGYDKLEKQMALGEAQRAAAPTRKPLVEARAEAERLAAHLAELEESLVSVERELTDLLLAREPTGKHKSKAMEPSRRIAKIATLEERLARLPSEVEATRMAHQQADEALASAERVAKEAEDRRTAAMHALMVANAALERGLAKERAMRKLAELSNRPVSVFISRAKQRLYVRQGYDEIFDVEVTFERPDDPVGTHVFTALAVAENKTDMTWSVASVPYVPSRSAMKKKSRTLKAPEPVPAVNPASQTAAAALDRITIPEDARAQISDVMKPGSSIVISDLGIGNETGAYTDFIVPLR